MHYLLNETSSVRNRTKKTKKRHFLKTGFFFYHFQYVSANIHSTKILFVALESPIQYTWHQNPLFLENSWFFYNRFLFYRKNGYFRGSWISENWPTSENYYKKTISVIKKMARDAINIPLNCMHTNFWSNPLNGVVIKLKIRLLLTTLKKRPFFRFLFFPGQKKIFGFFFIFFIFC